MKRALPIRRRAHAQTLVFLTLSIAAILLLCGLAIDSGLLYLAKARLSRAVDGAALAAVGNFSLGIDTSSGRPDRVADIMRSFAVANFEDLGSGPAGGVSSSVTPTTSTDTNPNTGKLETTYLYNFNDGTKDANGQYKRYVQVILTTGAGGQVTKASCSARCPVKTYFMGIAGAYFQDLKVSSIAVATRNPRLIMVVVDRSASMLLPGGGAYGLTSAIVQFLDFFDTSSDYIGIVSFSSNARLEMPLTTNFLIAGTNALGWSYEVVTNANAYEFGPYDSYAIPGVDPEEYATNGAGYDPNYATTGVRRLKFGGGTAADEGIRLGLEQLAANPGFNNPDVVKYMVIFTDGQWNNARTLLAAPGYTNVIEGPPTYVSGVNIMVPGVTNLIPNLSPAPDASNAMYDAMFDESMHEHDVWQSLDSNALYEPLPLGSGSVGGLEGAPAYVDTNADYYYDTVNNKYPFLGTNSDGLPMFTSNINVWLQPGSVDYVYRKTGSTEVHVSNYNSPTDTVNITLNTGDTNVLVVPGYVVDGLFSDTLDLDWTYQNDGNYPYYAGNNYNEPFMWPDAQTPLPTGFGGFASWSPWGDVQSTERYLMFRNYANLLTGFYVFRADDPLGTGIEHFITDAPAPGQLRPLNGLGPYYPSAAFYWPFDLVGIAWDGTFCLTNAVVDLDATQMGLNRRLAYSINMLSPAAAPEWTGELFYKGTQGNQVYSGTNATSISTTMSDASQWMNGAPGWLTAAFNVANGTMVSDAVHNTNLNVQILRPQTFSGSNGPVDNSVDLTSISQKNDLENLTGGYVTDGAGHYWRNAMAWSGRPTHYFDFSTGSWVRISHNHETGLSSYPLCVWKAQEYAWHARDMGVTIYTVGYGGAVGPVQQVLLAQVANATNTTAGNPQDPYTPGPGTGIPFNPKQPIGEQFYATNAADISNDFYQVGQAINASLTQ